MKIISACCMIFPLLMPMGSQADDSQPYAGAINIRPKAFFKDTTIWPSLDIPVCWEYNISPILNNTPYNRGLVQTAIEQSWARQDVSLVRFSGWGWCPSGTFSGVRISLSSTWDKAPITHGLGKEVLNIHPATNMRGVTLDFRLITQINGKSNLQRCADNGKNLDQCIKFTAVHEFGHVLGLSHEHNRPDDPDVIPNGFCHTNDSTSNNVMGNTLFTDYDPNSIMNYCRQQYWGDSSLSAIDMLAVKAYYGNIPNYIAEDGTLFVPRVMVNNRPHLARLQYNNGKFDLMALIDMSGNDKPSSATATFSYPNLSLPLLSFISGGKVTQLWKAILQYSSDGKFTLLGEPNSARLQPTSLPSAARLPTSSVTGQPFQ